MWQLSSGLLFLCTFINAVWHIIELFNIYMNVIILQNNNIDTRG